MDGWTGGRVDGWTGGWMGWMDGGGSFAEPYGITCVGREGWEMVYHDVT